MKATPCPRRTAPAVEALEARRLLTVPSLVNAVYNVTGHDSASWNGSRLTFTAQVATPAGANVEGYFDWNSNGRARGRELFRGSVANDLHLAFSGYRLVNPINIALADYRGTLSSNGAAITNGTWGGAGVQSGVWSATRVGATPEVDVRGGSNLSIADGDTTPSSSDQTLFGTAVVGVPVVRTFTVRNTGSAALNTSGLTVPAGFSVDPSDRLAASIPAGGQDTFKVRLDATAAGTFSGDVSFANNDANENPYNFAVRGVVNVPTFSIVNGTLTVTGTAGNDLIRGSAAGSFLTMRVNGQTRVFNNASSIRRIVVNALGGNDQILLAQSVRNSTSLNGGAGNDIIYGGSGPDTINGGAGTDLAFRGGADSVSLVEEVLS